MRRFCAIAVLVLLILTPTPARAATPSLYGVSALQNLTVTMDDGVVIAAQVIYPTDLTTGARAPGTFPVLLSQDPYGIAGPFPSVMAGRYFVQHGYIYIATSVRGTGSSGGRLDWFGARQGRDGAELVDWAAHALPGSDGTVGLDGCSYLGINQWFTAAAVGPHSPLKVIAPFCTDSDFYNDFAALGGIPTTAVADTGDLEPRGPQDNPATDPQSETVNDLATGGPRSYNNRYWQDRSVIRLMPAVVANNIPALTEAGWHDLFPGGNLGAYTAAQNAYFHRPLTAPVRPGDRVTARYQAIVGPWEHQQNVDSPTMQAIRLAWFDTWLKHTPTAMATTRTPLHLFQTGANRWVDVAAWPPSPATATFDFGADTKTLAWAPSSALTYTSAPLTHAAVLDGPSTVTVHASSTTTDVQLTATLTALTPDGSVVKQAEGVLIGSQRKLDPRISWYGSSHALLQPSHPFTKASRQPVTPGVTTRYDIALLATFALLPAGTRLQLTLTSQAPATFHLTLAPTPQQLSNLAGGIYTIEQSILNVPLADPALFHTSTTDWGPSS
ncbi:CocE/NonD family hydrolase [Winogradskya humida]|uniref:Acyl esterase n=1 Tax=Winogradskya humida TaxID=113566 RepID=A0ABQ3ZHE5_9ACTN|nr:CocE/NonD family hydrolase [Actinoplanes humidus]GIE17980.1 acyl esterase [Actinoplanes humidus]